MTKQQQEKQLRYDKAYMRMAMEWAKGAVNPFQHQVGKRLVRLKRNDFGAMPQPNPANSVFEIQNISPRPVFLFR